MQLSSNRILTTHVGSLPRPDALGQLLLAQLAGEAYDDDALAGQTAVAVSETVKAQVEVGVDVVSDGEMGKTGYTFYVRDRLAGIGDRGNAHGAAPGAAINRDELDHPDFHARRKALAPNFNTGSSLPGCIGPVTYEDRTGLERDLENFTDALTATPAVEGFLNAASPGVLTKFVPNFHYPDEDAYMEALGEAMRVEYEAIHAAGFLLQIDCPDLASARHNQYQDLTDKEFLRIADRNVEVLNHATANIPAEEMRMHICWGNYEGPHTHDVPFATVFETCMRARPSGLSFEGANPRHAHEWEDLRNKHIPDDKVLLPGVIDSTTNFVEHPKLVAQRICHYADIVGRERVIAGTDCGFATFVTPHNQVVTSVVWAKLRALAEGAAIATERLWGDGHEKQRAG